MTSQTCQTCHVLDLGIGLIPKLSVSGVGPQRIHTYFILYLLF